MSPIEGPGDYATRDGRKAVILGYNPYGSFHRRWIGYVNDQTSEWGDDGAFQPGGNSDRDIVGPWKQAPSLTTLVEAYCEQRDHRDPDVTLEQVLRAVAAEIAALKAAHGR